MPLLNFEQVTFFLKHPLALFLHTNYTSLLAALVSYYYYTLSTVAIYVQLCIVITGLNNKFIARLRLYLFGQTKLVSLPGFFWHCSLLKKCNEECKKYSYSYVASAVE